MNIARILSVGAVALAALSTVALTAPVAAATDWKTVTITLEGAYAPWNLTNPDGTLGGSSLSSPSIFATI